MTEWKTRVIDVVLIWSVLAFIGVGLILGLAYLELSQPVVEQSEVLMLEGRPSIIRVYDANGVLLDLASPEAQKIVRGGHQQVIVP